MAKIECKSAQRGVASKWLEIEGITDEQLIAARQWIGALIGKRAQVSDAIAEGFLAVIADCPTANPSDLWQHVVYRYLLDEGWSDNRWKRVSGYALERAIVALYAPRLAPHGVRLRLLPAEEANVFLARLVTDVRATKIDVFMETRAAKGVWTIFGAVHVKSSIAERIQDDVPASRLFMERGLLSILLTMDAKSYPPPHGECINFGELGGRSVGDDPGKVRIKRDYIERTGQFDALFSFNLRTPQSGKATPSGKRIYTMSMNEDQPDQLVRFVVEYAALVQRE